jgi:hypothetical protein
MEKRMRPSLATFPGAVAALCLACGASGPETASHGPRDAPGTDAYPVELAPPEHGIQVRTVGREIPPGADQEWCEVVELPGDPDDTYFVGRTEIAMAPHSHHLIISVAPEGSPRLDEEALGIPRPCSGAHVFGTNLVTLAGSAKLYTSDELPGGIGHVLHGGQRLVFDYHALNSSDAPVPAAHRLNLHTVDHIDRQARVFGFYNQYIEIPPHSSRTFIDECFLQDDVLVWSLLRHTHRRGTKFEVSWAGGAHDTARLWTSTDWEQDISFRFAEPFVMPAGTGFRWECAFDNPTDETLTFGLQATDEMCILFGQFASVGDGDEVPPQSCYRFVPP